jgi:hypothetical protein
MNTRKPLSLFGTGSAALAVGGIALALLFPAWANVLRSVSGDYGPPCGGFDDVDPASSFCTSLEWVRNRGVTVGCNADGTQYCPWANVTRAQMAIFLSRLDRVLVPTLIDANGTAIGAYARESSPLVETVFYRTGGQLYSLPLLPHGAGPGFYQFSTGTAHFASPSCSGQAYLDTSDTGRVVGRRHYRVVRGEDASQRLFATAPESPLAYFPVASYLSQGACFQAPSSTVLGRAADAIEDLNARFDVPFQLQ